MARHPATYSRIIANKLKPSKNRGIWELYLCKMESLQGPKEHWQHKQRKSYTSYERLLKLLSFQPISVMCELFNTIVLPVLCYGAEIWGMIKSEEIEKIQFQFCKFILQVPTRAPALTAELGRFPLLLHTQLKATNYFVCTSLQISHTI